jgi:hypothetical protein
MGPTAILRFWRCLGNGNILPVRCKPHFPARNPVSVGPDVYEDPRKQKEKE